MQCTGLEQLYLVLRCSVVAETRAQVLAHRNTYEIWNMKHTCRAARTSASTPRSIIYDHEQNDEANFAVRRLQTPNPTLPDMSVFALGPSVEMRVLSWIKDFVLRSDQLGASVGRIQLLCFGRKMCVLIRGGFWFWVASVVYENSLVEHGFEFKETHHITTEREAGMAFPQMFFDWRRRTCMKGAWVVYVARILLQHSGEKGST